MNAVIRTEVGNALLIMFSCFQQWQSVTRSIIRCDHSNYYEVHECTTRLPDNATCAIQVCSQSVCLGTQVSTLALQNCLNGLQETATQGTSCIPHQRRCERISCAVLRCPSQIDDVPSIPFLHRLRSLDHAAM